MAQAANKSELFVRGIPLEVTSEELTDFFSDFAPVRNAVIVNDPATGSSKGFGFVSLTSPEDAAEAIAGSRKNKLRNTNLRVDYAKPRQRSGQEKEPREETERRRPRLIIRNIPWSLRDPKELIEIFSKYGKVTEAFIPRGPNNRMSGFAFVTMRRQVNAAQAVEECKGLEIKGRPVTVDFAVSKNKYVSQKEEEEEDKEEEEEEEEEEDEEGEDKPKEVKPKQRGLGEDKTIFVRNIPYEATQDSLKTHFEQFGPVAYALLVMDKALNQPKGEAFVAFHDSEVRDKCVSEAPAVVSSSLLIPDDVESRYVYEGRVLNVTGAVKRESATRLADKAAKERLETLGKAPKQKDKRNLFLLNEGRVTSKSKLAEVLTTKDMEIRDKSYQMRKQQVNKNPSLHLSLTRLAIRNLPRSVQEVDLKALGRKAVVEFAKEVADNKRHALSKEEVMRSVHHQESLGVSESTSSKNKGVVKQAKVIQEVKDSGETGRSRGYGFLEMRNHKAALMALRWLNGHLVGDNDGLSVQEKRRLVVEFAVENAQVVKRQQERRARAIETGRKRRAEEAELEEKEKEKKAAEKAEPSGNAVIGRKRKQRRLKK